MSHAPSFAPRVVAHAAALCAAFTAMAALQAAHAQQAPAPRPAASAAEDDAPRAKDDVIRLGTITVTGQGDRLGAGQIINEDTFKSRSTITRAAMEKDRATGNLYQSIELLPSVNSFNHDATGLFGGGLSMRGFNSDQIGFTINGVPVNDSGSYAVFPQEYVDQENVCTNTVSQGSSDQETPHIGASGGSIGLTTCDPSKTRKVQFGQTLGGLGLRRTFVGFHTGNMFNDRFRAFASYSKSKSRKWKGEGGADRDHVDTGFSWTLAPGHTILGVLNYNTAVNNNINNPTLTELRTNGYYWDNTATFRKTVAVNGTAQTETGSTPAYYLLATNPFENAIASLSGSFQLSDALTLKVQPYFWYGYGTGGIQQTTITESNFLTPAGTLTGTSDINGDGDTRDRLIVARSNVTHTLRPGFTVDLNYLAGDHSIRVGLWAERARHAQTAPAVRVDAAGNPTTIWLDEGRILRADGTEYQNRNWQTNTKASAFYITDNYSFNNNRGLISAGVRFPRIERDFTNKPSEGGVVGYNIARTFSDVLPQVGFRLNMGADQQVFGNIAKNFRAPPNFAYAPTNGTIRIVNGQVQEIQSLVPETSVNTDLGYRLQNKALSFSASLFNVTYSNRQGNAFDPLTNLSVYTNLGNVRNRGLELEVGTRPVKGLTFYASTTTQHSKILNDVRTSAAVILPLTGKEFTNTPRRMFALSTQYAQGPWYVRVKAKDTGRQFASLMNDEETPAYTKIDLDGGYKFGDIGMAKGAQLRWNISNLFNKQYRNNSSGAVTNGQPVVTSTGTFGAQTIRYYLGAPRLFSMSFNAEF
jgi:iron complex outermembrane recepter protein